MLLRQGHKRCLPHLALASLLVASSAVGQEADPGLQSAGGENWEVDFLLNYYDQDGDHSPVTGGIGTEELDVISPVFVVRWDKSEKWSFQSSIGIDTITSASTDNMDLGEAVVSGASRVDARAFTQLTATRATGTQNLGFTLGLSNEYDYQSLQAGLSWNRSFRANNTTVGASVRHYNDTVELYGIDGVQRGDDSRTTTDLTLSLSQVLSPKTILSVELYVSDQSGFLSTPFHEVLLAPEPGAAEGLRVAERLPDARRRTAVGLRLNHAVTPRFVPRLYYRFYDDDWGISASTIELEPHFRVSERRSLWIFPILRYHSQESSDYFAPAGTFVGNEPFITADRDLGEFTSEKLGMGWRASFRPNRSGWKSRVRWIESRVTTYSRDDGLDALSISLGFGFAF